MPEAITSRAPKCMDVAIDGQRDVIVVGYTRVAKGLRKPSLRKYQPR
jgi:hypothetical protein